MFTLNPNSKDNNITTGYSGTINLPLAELHARTLAWVLDSLPSATVITSISTDAANSNVCITYAVKETISNAAIRDGKTTPTTNPLDNIIWTTNGQDQGECISDCATGRAVSVSVQKKG